jgi:hypothetical protein
MGWKGGAVAHPQLKAAAQIENCYAVDTIRFRGNRVNKQISHWFNNSTSYCKIGSYSAKAMIAAMDGKKPSAGIVGHVDPDTPNPAGARNKK